MAILGSVEKFKPLKLKLFDKRMLGNVSLIIKMSECKGSEIIQNKFTVK